MLVLGIESSCDETAVAVVEDGIRVLSNVVATQIPFHAAWQGVVPEIASRKHTEWILPVTRAALKEAGVDMNDIGGVAATARPGLLGSLLVGHTFAKTLAWARGLPFIGVNHMLAHLYASRLSTIPTPHSLLPTLPSYPFLALLVSGGHTIIARADNFDNITVLGASRDDAVGEAFDKFAKHYGFGYPGGKYVDELAGTGDSDAFRFPVFDVIKDAKTHHKTAAQAGSPYDVSYSGLKTAAINQVEQFRRKGTAGEVNPNDLAASFQKAAVEILLGPLLRAARDTGLSTIVAGGGVAANSYLRARLAAVEGLRCVFPPADLCGDNGAMVAGLGWHYLERGDRSPLTETASARVRLYKSSGAN
jgi:N6-L-threonylcarbamoyladenine synthase